MKWRIELAECAEIPLYYGIAYYRPEYARAVCYPIPVNHIVSAWRVVSRWLMLPPWRTFEWKMHELERRALSRADWEQARREKLERAMLGIANLPDLDLRLLFEEIQWRDRRVATGSESVPEIMRTIARDALRYPS